MGTVTKSGTLSAHPSSYDTSNHSYASISSSYPITNAYTDSSSTTYCQVSWKTGSQAETYVYLRFDFSDIPANATITSVSATANGYVNTTNSSRVTTRQMQLCTGTTLKGSALTISNSVSEQTFSNTGTWTRAELNSAGIRYYVKRGTSNTSSTYQMRMYGATMTVNYTWQETAYTVTVSGAGASPAGETDVVSGESFTARSSETNRPNCTDNGTDVTSQLVQVTETGESYEVRNVTTSYGFAMNGNGYYESDNQGRSNTCALCVVNFHLPVDATVTFTVINYAEATYDFGLLSEVDETLSTSASADSSNVYWSGQNHNSSSPQTVTYNMTAGDHFVYVKYFKDNYTDDGNDSLQFKVSITNDEPFTPGTYWEYTIASVTGDHAIIFAVASSDKILFKNGGSWVEAVKVYKKVNGSWVEQSNLTNVFQAGVNYKRG